MQINPYLFFDSNCEAAFKFYEKVLGGKIELMLRNSEGPPEMGTAPDRMQKIMHARMSIDGEVIMASDAPPIISKSRRALRYRSPSTIPPRPSASSRRCRRGAPSTCRSARPSSRRALACVTISSAFPGW